MLSVGFFIAALGVVMLSVIMLSVVMPKRELSGGHIN
jgi:hypothetical protein